MQHRIAAHNFHRWVFNNYLNEFHGSLPSKKNQKKTLMCLLLLSTKIKTYYRLPVEITKVFFSESFCKIKARIQCRQIVMLACKCAVTTSFSIQLLPTSEVLFFTCPLLHDMKVCHLHLPRTQKRNLHMETSLWRDFDL